jgi:hypothetical protein
MVATGEFVLLICDEAHVSLSPGEKGYHVPALALTEDRSSVWEGRISYMRTYRERTGLIWRERQERSGGEYQPRSPGSSKNRHYPIKMFSTIGFDRPRPLSFLDELFVGGGSGEAARRHSRLAHLAGLRPDG